MKAGAGDSESLSVTGLALLCVLAGSFVYGTALRLQGEAYEWAIYLTLGTIFPALLLLFSLSKRFTASGSTLSRASQLALALLALLVSLVFVVEQRQFAAFGLSIAQLSLFLVFLRRERQPIKLSSILMSFVVIVIAWTIAASMLWWSPLGGWFFSGDNSTENGYRFLVCLLSLLLVFLNLHDEGAPDEKPRVRWWWWVANLAAVLLFALASVRSDQLFNTMSYSHWGVIVGPAEMVRQGGWLLWDVPTQYGFLNILLVAVLPVKSIWQAAYLINSFLLFASAIFLFFLLRSIRPGWKNFCFSLLVTLAAIFLMAGWPPALLGPQVFPSLGPFRFIWCYALLALLIREFTDANKSFRRIPLIGNVVWLIGTLWSSESAVYCAAIWIPAYALIALHRANSLYPEPMARNKRLRLIAGWLFVPLLMLATTIGLMTIYYLLRLGHVPDWRAFYEYSLAFAGGFFAIPIDPNGPVWQLFLIFCALSTTAVYFLRDGLAGKAMSLLAGTWGALWATSSYFVSRSHPNNATVLSPILCVAIGVMLYLLARHQRGERWTRLVKMSFVPFLTILLTATFGNAGFLRLYLTSPQLGYQQNIDTHLPTLDPSLVELFRAAQVKTDDPIVYSAVRVKAVEPLADGLSHDHGVLLPAWPTDDGRLISATRAWLPATPFVLLVPLPEERRQVYMERFIARARLSGWLVQNKKEAPYTSSAWFYDQLLKTHAPARMFENADWQLIWFEFNGITR